MHLISPVPDGWRASHPSGGGGAGSVGLRWPVGVGGPCQVACNPTLILSPHSLAQALLMVLSQALCFLAVEWYLPLLVSSLVLGWLNLLYYTRGLQHTGIYSVMIQKVRDGGGLSVDRAGYHPPAGLLLASADRRPPPQLAWAEENARASLSGPTRADICRYLPSGSVLCRDKQTHDPGGVRASSASSHLRGADTGPLSSSVGLCPGASGPIDFSAFIHLFNRSLGSVSCGPGLVLSAGICGFGR